jgi:hypothetical protein
MCSQPFAPSFFEKTAALSFVFFQKMSNLFGSFRTAPISRGDCWFQVTRNDFFLNISKLAPESLSFFFKLP